MICHAKLKDMCNINTEKLTLAAINDNDNDFITTWNE